MARTGAESKPPWSEVPQPVKDEVARVLGSPVVRAERAYGGYAPSATFRLRLATGERAFFKATYPTKHSEVHWGLEREERVYRACASLMRPWAPEYLGALRHGEWHVLLLEDLGPASVPPWTPAKTVAAARSYAAFHARTRKH